jgi:hypothetical protein
MKKLFPIVATLLVLAISGCAPQVDVEADEAAIRNLETEVVAAENAGDVDASIPARLRFGSRCRTRLTSPTSR